MDIDLGHGVKVDVRGRSRAAQGWLDAASEMLLQALDDSNSEDEDEDADADEDEDEDEGSAQANQHRHQDDDDGGHATFETPLASSLGTATAMS